jgi:hypothetical protein
MNIREKVRKMLNRIENSKTPFAYFLLTFFFVITLRNFFDLSYNLLVFPRHTPFIKMFLEELPHLYLFYIDTVLAMAILFHFAVKERIEKILKVIMSFSFVLAMAPIIDLTVFLLTGRYFTAAYMFPGSEPTLLSKFLSFFGPLTPQGITPGMRIEIGLVLAASCIYFLAKKKGVPASLFFTLLNYALIFSYCASPYALKWPLNVLGLEYSYSSSVMQNFYLVLTIFLLGPLLYLKNREPAA